MIRKETGIEGLFIVEPKVFEDDRGYFFESYHADFWARQGVTGPFVQDNQSRSSQGVIRGLHLQKEPFAQSKLVRVIEGEIYDVAVDLRPDSPTFRSWFGIELSAGNRLQLMIPKGFAHGFSVLSTHATVLYKCDAYYDPASEAGIRYDDPELRIDWKTGPSPVVSEKDRNLPFLNTFIQEI
jgi:dTDP-4-dehydrorhamnose 3,5-epimerase